LHGVGVDADNGAIVFHTEHQVAAATVEKCTDGFVCATRQVILRPLKFNGSTLALHYDTF
jgi:hypothetical protein